MGVAGYHTGVGWVPGIKKGTQFYCQANFICGDGPLGAGRTGLILKDLTPEQ